MGLLETIDYLPLFFQFIKKPFVIGTVAPSSKILARRMVESVDFGNVGTIVEYGPGNGVFSKEILNRIRPETKLFAIEIDKKTIDYLRQNLPELTIYHDSVVNVSKYLDKHDSEHADVIISGLPWAVFKNELQDSLLNETLKALREGGEFVTFMYVHSLALPLGKRFYKKMLNNFSSINRSPVTWKNFPPAYIFRCIK